MAHFCKLNFWNKVERVEVVSNDIVTTEQAGIDFLNNLYKTNDAWVQTSYNENFRKNFASIGFEYNQTKDAFIPPQPYPSWTLNEDTCKWEAPISKPNNTNIYKWNEDTTSWDLI